MFNKILIANRGEIACRIARSARAMGVRTVAIYSDADSAALHLSACDEAVHIGPTPAAESYLCADRIISAALSSGAQAIHPGFGFLSENADFAKACAREKLIFIGPKPESISDMGSKSEARRIMRDAGVSVLPGYDGVDQSASTLRNQAGKVGFPLLIKAVSGGGGKGLRVVGKIDEFNDALFAVKRESMSAFGNDAVLLEHYLPDARHIEVQIFADSHGNVVHLFERDCSLQRRHQKVIEEAPAPGISADLRSEMVNTAILCAHATGYVGAGTVEFLLAKNQQYFFIEMNTRLQVEHPVTEMITGVDLVAWQLKVAAGQLLPLDQTKIAIHGHAIEARIYAENPDSHFLPSSGVVTFLQFPAENEHVRIDTGIAQGDEISAYYDPMIAKLICKGEDRKHALARLKQALNETYLSGPKSNIRFLTTLCSQPDVINGGAHTQYIDRHLEQLTNIASPLQYNAAIIAAAVHFQNTTETIQAHQLSSSDPASPWAASDGWQIGKTAGQRIILWHERQRVELTIRTHAESWEIYNKTKTISLRQLKGKSPHFNALIDGLLIRALVTLSLETIEIQINNHSFTFVRTDPHILTDTLTQQNDSLCSPMPGRIIACPAHAGQSVKKDQTLMVIEAMKMEHPIQAPYDGVVDCVYFALDDQVEEGQKLLDFEDAK